MRLTPDDSRSLMSALTADAYAAETVAKTLRWIRLTLTQAVSDRRIGRSPADGIRLPKPRRGAMRILQAAEVQTLADAIPERYRPMVIVAAYTGLRFGELAGLSVNDIDMLRRRPTVTNSLVEVAGELPRLAPPKTPSSERTITLPRIAVDALAEHLASYPSSNGVVWTTDRGQFLRRGSFGRIWRTAVAESVGAPCRLHDLRHTHVAWLIATGEHPRAIMTRLGHASITNTINTYGWLMDGLDEQTAGRLDEFAHGTETAQNGPDMPSTISSSNAETPAEAGVSELQPRPGSNWRYRLERPAS